MDERIFFRVRINIPDLDKHDPDAQKSGLEYEAELVFHESGSQIITFIPFYNYEKEINLTVWKHVTHANL